MHAENERIIYKKKKSHVNQNESFRQKGKKESRGKKRIICKKRIIREPRNRVKVCKKGKKKDK